MSGPDLFKPLLDSFHIAHIETLIIRIARLNINIIAIYRLPSVPLKRLLETLAILHNLTDTSPTVFLGDFNVNWLDHKDRIQLHRLMVTKLNYHQQICSPTTDFGSCLDHIYFSTSLSGTASVLESYYSDHKPVWCSVLAG